MTGSVTPLRQLHAPTGVVGPLEAIWTDRVTPTRYEIRAHSTTGLLRCELRLGQLAGDLDPAAVTRMLAQIIGGYEPGAAALMLDSIEGKP